MIWYFHLTYCFSSYLSTFCRGWACLIEGLCSQVSHSCFPVVHTQITSKKNTKEAKGKGGRVHKKDKHYKGQVMGN